jgi:hypothetical protein
VAASVTAVCGCVVFVTDSALGTETRRVLNTVRPSVVLLGTSCVMCFDRPFTCV